MNEQIEDFITNIYTPEFVILIRKAFSLFEAFEHNNAYDEMNDAVTNESVSDPIARSEHFAVALANQLSYVIEQHLIKLTDTATIVDQIEILDALYRFQHLENYIAIDAILSSEDDEIDMMSRILDELTDLGQGHILSILKEVDKRTLSLMRAFIINKTNVSVSELVDPKITERIKLFAETFGKDYVGYVLIEAGMRLGYPLKLYIPFVHDYFVIENNQSQTALNILSVLYMSDVNEKDMLATFREVGEEIFKSLDEVGKVESYFINHIAKIEEVRKINHEKAGLSQESSAEQSGK